MEMKNKNDVLFEINTYGRCKIGNFTIMANIGADRTLYEVRNIVRKVFVSDDVEEAISYVEFNTPFMERYSVYSTDDHEELGEFMNLEYAKDFANECFGHVDVFDAHTGEVLYTNEDSIMFLDLSVRAYNILYRAGIQTVTDLKAKSFDELSALRNMGVRTLAEIFMALMRDDKHLSRAQLLDVAERVYGGDNDD